MEGTNNITQTIIDTINTIFETLFASIDNNLYSVLDEITFINSDILNDSNFEKLFGTSTSNGILLIANSLLLGFLLYYGFKYLMSHITYHKVDSPFSFVIKIVVFGICMNFSFFIVQMLLDLNSNISLAIRSLGENLFGKNICFSELINTINTKASIDTSSLNIFSIDGLIKSTLSISLLSLVFSYSLRYIMVKVFVLLAPFAFISLCTDNTSWFFKAWLKNLFSLLFIQIIVSLVLLILFSLDFDEDNSNIFPSEMDLNILYEDDCLIIVNKPAHMPVHPSLNHYADSLSNGLKFYFNKINLKRKIRPINRLDKDTSGIVIFAKNEYAQDRIRITSKIYLAILTGHFEGSSIIDKPIARKDKSIIERCIDENGEKAITEYSVIKNFKIENEEFSLVKCILHTGRTHQIRVHMSSINHPIIGDSLYGMESKYIDRQALHAYKIKFIHPITKKEIEVTVPIPDDIKNVLDNTF